MVNTQQFRAQNTREDNPKNKPHSTGKHGKSRYQCNRAEKSLHWTSICIYLAMYGTVKIERKEDIELISQFAGCPPCLILVLNNAKTAEELVGREIIVKFSLAKLVKPC